MWTNKTTRATEKIITNVFPNRLAEEILGFTSARWSNCQSGSLRTGCRIFRFPALSFIGRLYNQHHNYLYHYFSLKIGRLTLNIKLQIWGRLSTTMFCWWSLPLCIKDPRPLDIPPSSFPCWVLYISHISHWYLSLKLINPSHKSWVGQLTTSPLTPWHPYTPLWTLGTP